MRRTYERKDKMSNIYKIIEEVAKEHPYRVPGDRDSYDRYAEGWTDAVNRIDSMLHDESDTSSEEHCGTKMPIAVQR